MVSIWLAVGAVGAGIIVGVAFMLLWLREVRTSWALATDWAEADAERARLADKLREVCIERDEARRTLRKERRHG